MIYRARYLLPMDGSVIHDGEVLVHDGRIEAVGTDLAWAHPGEPVCDLGESVLMPGFVNAHTHIDYTMSRASRDGLNLWDWIDHTGFRPGRVPDYDALLASATLGAMECLRSGVTCVGDSTFSGAAAEAVESAGLRGVVYREIFGQSMGKDYSERFAELLDEVRRMQSRLSSRVKMGISPHAVYTSNRGLLELCAEACADLDIPFAIHLAETRAETDYLVSGTGPLAEWRRRLGFEPMVSGLTPTRYLDDIGLLQEGVCLAHCVHVSEDEVELIAASGAGVAHCPRSNAFLGAGIAPVPKFIAAQARVGIGTDSPASSLSLDFFEEMRFALATHRAATQEAGALTAKDVLRHATLGGAEAVGIAREVGSLEVGKRADMVAVDVSGIHPEEELHLAVISKSPRDVKLVVVEGDEIVKDGIPTRLDPDECRERLREVME